MVEDDGREKRVVYLTGSPILVSWELVSPEQAQQWLDEAKTSNVENRKKRAAHIERIASQIRRGQWRPTHQGIAFDVDGQLIDGQHRLEAIVMANTAVWMFVFRGVPTESKTVIDTHAVRNLSDAATTLGLKMATTDKTAALRAMFLMRGGLRTLLSREDWLDIYQKHVESVDFAVRVTSTLPRTVRHSITAAVLARAVTVYPTAHEQLKRAGVVLQEGLLEGVWERPLILYRNMCLENRGELDPRRRYGLMEKALYLFLRRETALLLRPSSTELFPIPMDSELPVGAEQTP